VSHTRGGSRVAISRSSPFGATVSHETATDLSFVHGFLYHVCVHQPYHFDTTMK
jgi:hypothetical protein